METELRERIESVAEEYALYNAVKHDSEAEAGAILGPLMGDHPDFRPHGDRIMELVAPVVNRVNDLSPSERRSRLGELAPDRLAELEAEPEETEEPALPPLPNAEEVEQVRLRCAPNPNGPWHIGSARMGAVMGTYAEMYDGWLLVRFDDTDPATKRPDPDAYDAIIQDLSYLGFEPDAELRASDRLEIYYQRAREVINRGGMYACSCPQEEFSALKREGEACPHRDQDPADTRSHLESMIAGEYSEGEMVIRVRTDMSAPNPAERDWVALRIVDTPHPLESAAEYRCWPMLDYQSAIDDHATGITHIIRGKDLQDSERRQQYLYEYFDWSYPEVLHWGRIQVDEYDVTMSTSTIRQLIEAGELDGWSDPRAPTLQSLKRRGIRGEAVTDTMTELGVSTSDVSLAMSTVYARNRELVDEGADRYFMVQDGMTVPLVGEVPERARPPRHPEDDSRGYRDIPVGEAVEIETDDLPAHGERSWLKGLGCVRFHRDSFELTGESIEVVREEEVPVIHWVPAEHAIAVDVLSVQGMASGHAEPGVREVPPDTVVQFERQGFARIDRHETDRTVVYFSHP